MASKASPPKPWEVRKASPSGSGSLPVSSSVAKSAQELAMDPGNSGLPVERMDPNARNPHIGSPTANSLTPRLPPRPGGIVGGSLNNSYSPYNSLTSRYGSYNGGSGYGSNYGYGGTGYGSNYGGYGSNYGSSMGRLGYGASYGSSGYGTSGYGTSGYGSSGYGGSSYGGYSGGGYGSYSGYAGNSYGRYGYGYREGAQPQGAFQNVLDGGHQQMNRFGAIVESFSRFSHLLDANFDALHGSFASVLRLLDVFGEFFYVVRTFAVFRLLFGGVGKFWKVLNLMLGRNITSNNKLKSEGLEVEDYKKFQANQGQKGRLPLMFVVLGILATFLPILLVRLWRSFSSKLKMLEAMEPEMEDLWRNQPQRALARAKFPFPGETEMDLPFREGELVQVIGKPFPDWWEGEINGRRGLFPSSYVEEEQPKRTE